MTDKSARAGQHGASPDRPTRQQDVPKNPADPARGRPQQVEQGKDGDAGSSGKEKSRGAEDESRGKEGGVSPGAQQMQRDRFSGEPLPRDPD